MQQKENKASRKNSKNVIFQEDELPQLQFLKEIGLETQQLYALF